MMLVALPPGIHPVATERPPAAYVEFCTEVGHQRRVVKQIGFQRHVERRALGYRRLFGDLRGRFLRRDLPDDGVRGLDGFAPRLLCKLRFRLRLRRRFRLRLRENAPLYFAAQVHAAAPQLREEVLRHIPPRTAAAQHSQLAFASVHHLAVTNHPFRRIVQNIQHLVAVRHFRAFDQGRQSGPVDALGMHVERNPRKRKPLPEPCDDVLRPILRQTHIQLGGTLRRSRTGNTNPFYADQRIPLQSFELRGKSIQTRPVVPIGGFQNRIPLSEINLHPKGIGLWRLLRIKRPEEQHRY